MAGKKAEPVELAPRIHVSEFLGAHASKRLNDMQKAGFKVFCKKEYMRLAEWEVVFKEYLGEDKK